MQAPSRRLRSRLTFAAQRRVAEILPECQLLDSWSVAMAFLAGWSLES